MFIDLDQAIQIAGGNIKAAEALISEFIQELPDMLGRVNVAYDNNNPAVLEDEVHKLYGAAA